MFMQYNDWHHGRDTCLWKSIHKGSLCSEWVMRIKLVCINKPDCKSNLGLHRIQNTYVRTSMEMSKVKVEGTELGWGKVGTGEWGHELMLRNTRSRHYTLVLSVRAWIKDVWCCVPHHGSRSCPCLDGRLSENYMYAALNSMTKEMQEFDEIKSSSSLYVATSIILFVSNHMFASELVGCLTSSSAPDLAIASYSMPAS